MNTTRFYLFATPGQKPETIIRDVFYVVENQQVAEALCDIFNSEFTGVFFHCKAVACFSMLNQVRLDEAIDSLAQYDDPDRGLYDPEPSQHTIDCAAYASHATEWEDRIRDKLFPRKPPEQQPADSPSPHNPTASDDVVVMPAADWFNVRLHVLMMSAQLYHHLLASVTGVHCHVVDLDLNQNYLWALKNIRTTLDAATSPDMQDFPAKFDPAFADLYPSTIVDVDWADEIAPGADAFLSAVQAYVLNKGIHDPNADSPAAKMIAATRLQIEKAMESGNAYRKRMGLAMQQMLARVSPPPSPSPKDQRASGDQESQPDTRSSDGMPPTMEPQEITDLCCTHPNDGFLRWQSLEDAISRAPVLNADRARKIRAMRITFRAMFEDLGHWRDLDPKDKALDPDDPIAHAKHQKQIEEFIARRSAALSAIEYDRVESGHKTDHEGTDSESVSYRWTYFLADEPQLIIRFHPDNDRPPHADQMKQHYFKSAAPSGYAIMLSDGRPYGILYFANGESISFMPDLEANAYPEHLFDVGDYALRKVTRRGTTLEAVHAVAQEIKQIASPLPGALAKVGNGVEAVRLNTEAIAKNEYQLRQENTELRELANNGFLQFATRVEPDDFRAFAAIMITGNRNQAAKVLAIPQRSFYDLVDTWPSRGPDYRRMFRLADWRKKSGRKIKVRLEDSLLGTDVGDKAENPETIRDVLDDMRSKTDSRTRDDFLRDILQALVRQNAQNWQHVRAEVVGLLKEEVSQ